MKVIVLDTNVLLADPTDAPPPTDAPRGDRVVLPVSAVTAKWQRALTPVSDHARQRTASGRALALQVVRQFGGSISAEHGIGTIKKPYLAFCRSPEELALMRAVKAALDPKGLLNPGKVL